jgi:hypothetical protein
MSMRSVLSRVMTITADMSGVKIFSRCGLSVYLLLGNGGKGC